MSIESLEKLAISAEQAEAGEQQEAEQQQPGYESADDIRAKCEEKALYIVGGMSVLLGKISPESEPVVLHDKACADGVSKISDVLMKYPDAEPPAWMLALLTYKEEFMAGAWVAGVFYGVYKNEQLLAAKRAEEEAEKENADTPAGDE